MQKLTGKTQLLIGVTLFSMFFGAGNLIFPPSLGAQAGTLALPALIGFALSAVGLPVLGVVAVARSGGLETLTMRVGKGFTLVFTILIYLSIGPGLAIPRTASTSFEMAVTPFAGAQGAGWALRAAYSAAFFGVALLLALHPTRLREWLGKRLAPVLLLLIAALFVGCVAAGLQGALPAAEGYAASPATRGFLDGYQTMDAIAALIFGMVLAMNIRDCGVTETPGVVRATIRAGWLAGGLFLLVYGALTYIGVRAGANCAVEAGANGARLLTEMARRLFGPSGQILLAGIFVIACLNTCVGLVCCCAEYFHRLFPRVSYTALAVVFTALSAVVSNVGLDDILRLSVPVLGCLYPVVIALIFLAFLPNRLAEGTYVYAGTVALAALVSVLTALSGTGVPLVSSLVAALPLSGEGLGWVLPAAVGGAAGLCVRKARKNQ